MKRETLEAFEECEGIIAGTIPARRYSSVDELMSAVLESDCTTEEYLTAVDKAIHDEFNGHYDNIDKTAFFQKTLDRYDIFSHMSPGQIADRFLLWYNSVIGGQ